MIIKIQFANYKKLENFSSEFSSGNLYFVKASNNEGKTTFLQGLLATVEGKGSNKKAISFGKAEASVKTQILEFKGADGQNYSINYELAEGKADKFTIIKPDTTVSKKAGDITTIFHYNAFTVDEWFTWGTTKEGRRKQADVIMNMLPIELQNELRTLDLKVNATTGTLFEQRKTAKAIWENKKVEHAAIVFTDHETKMLAIPEYRQVTLDKIKERDDALLAGAGGNDLVVLKATTEKDIEFQKSEIIRIGESQALYRTQTAKAIEDLKAEILVYQTDLEKSDLEFEQEIFDKETYLAKKETALLGYIAQIAEKDPVDIPALTASLLIRADYVKILDEAERKQKNQTELLLSIQDAYKKTEDLTVELEAGRKRKVEIIATAKLPVDNIAIEGDEIFYVDPEGNLLPFSEENISYAKGGYTVAQIMLAVNKDLPLLLVGKAAEYDNKALEALSKLAADNGAIIILDRVIPEESALQIECYETNKIVGRFNSGSKPTTVLVPLQNELENKPFNL